MSKPYSVSNHEKRCAVIYDVFVIYRNSSNSIVKFVGYFVMELFLEILRYWGSAQTVNVQKSNQFRITMQFGNRSDEKTDCCF